MIVWFRDDLRLADNPALTAAAETGAPVIPLYMDEIGSDTRRPMGGAARWWLHGALKSLADDLHRLGGRLILRRGSSDSVVALAREVGAQAVFWNRRYHPSAREQDADLKSALERDGVQATDFNGALIAEPGTVTTNDGGFYKVYTPFARALHAKFPEISPLKVPKRLAAPVAWPDSLALDDLKLRPTKPDWAGGLRETWTPGEAEADAVLDRFLDKNLTRYKPERDFAANDVTSRLSPYLRFGEISPRTVWARTDAAVATAGNDAARASAEKFQSEVLWREFAYNLLYHLPPIERENVQSSFDDFPWANDNAAIQAWQAGQTGYPIVDAGMRQLWQTGWLHNRVRMVVASFLTKDLLVDWRVGEAWFWDTLVDADPANNPASWQWVAGSGADAAPYFRIFNPVLQGKKFDPDGTYVRTFVPEIANLPDAYIHEPWRAPENALKKAGVVLGETYPKPIVDHGRARKRALAAYENIKGKAA
ncbi:deoxyribodipyrimidine photo-lyase [Amorphus sp. 3PC139-8]|uniref:cryptochrome/photolyase family protein n=1 Tax=Amorphus sp. 3PC139-8 TaxID=2735676 RepID=UPI00345D1A1E